MNFNRVVLGGRLTRDPRTRDAGASRITDFGLAVNRKYKVGDDEREEVLFVEVGFWGRTGEVIAQYLKKGDPIFLEGRLRFTEWEDEKTKEKRSKVAVVGERFEFVGGKRGSQDSAF